MTHRRPALLLILLLTAVLMVNVSLAAEAPGIVQDSAAVLSPAAIRDAKALSQRTSEAVDVTLALETRHFLGGADVKGYAQRLLDQLPQPENSLLLLMVVGEETYALAAGAAAARHLGTEARETLLSTHFRASFLSRQYDLAVAQFFTGAAERLSLATGKMIDLKGVFGQVTATATPAPTAVTGSTGTYKTIDLTGPNSILGEKVAPRPSLQPQYDQAREDRGMSIGSIVLTGLVLSMIFRKKNGRGGCGCGPLGWIFGVFGASKIFGWRK